MIALFSRGAALRSLRIVGGAAPALAFTRINHEQSRWLPAVAAGAALSSVLTAFDQSSEPSSCGKRGPQPAAKKAAAVPPPPRPKGKGPIKRTPTGAFDPAAKDDDIYQCEKIVAVRRLQHGLIAGAWRVRTAEGGCGEG